MQNKPPLFPALASTSGGGLTITTGPQRIATRMAENLLGVARSQERALAAQLRYRIGDYEFREADHAQIQRWARRLGMAPEKVVEVLATIGEKDVCICDAAIAFSVEDGAIVSLVWDFALLPLTDWLWGQDLQIADFGILNAPPGPLPSLPVCRYGLFCYDNPITSLTIAHSPQLRFFLCHNAHLTELDLLPVPGLETLDCYGNQLTTLDLIPVPGLQTLLCSDNRLTALDLMPVPGLYWLDCDNNQLTTLDLTPVPGLRTLSCSDNQLTTLDLTPVPGLRTLNCRVNQLTELDLTHVPGLQELNCDWNQLTELDLTPVPRLKWLCCDRSVYVKGAPKNLRIERQ